MADDERFEFETLVRAWDEATGVLGSGPAGGEAGDWKLPKPPSPKARRTSRRRASRKGRAA
jgi:hypothetical protein